MKQMIDGFTRFRQRYFPENRELFKTLAKNGQSPKALVIGCSDSRVDPSIIFDAHPGDIFVLRNVANLIPPYAPDAGHHGTSSAVEFAVRGLNVEHIVVLGHANCGGVRALLEGRATDESDFMAGWISIARSARDRALALTLSGGYPLDAARRLCEREVVAISLANLMTFPWIRERVEQGVLLLHGWFFDLESGELSRLDHLSNNFQTIT